MVENITKSIQNVPESNILDDITKEWAINCDVLLSTCCNSPIIFNNELPMCSKCQTVSKILKLNYV